MQDKFRMSTEDNIFYAKRNLIDSIYSEAQIEGINVTYPDTMEIFEGRAVAGLTIDETIAVNNLKHAWQFLLDNLDYTIDLRFIRQINSEVGNRIIQDAGLLRRHPVSIGGTSWKPDIPTESRATSTIQYILTSENSVTDKALDIMLYIMRAQLFMDGNKRTAQLTANAVMIAGGAGIIRIPVEHKKDFATHLINFYESDDSSTIKQFLYDYTIDGYNSTSSASNALTTKEIMQATKILMSRGVADTAEWIHSHTDEDIHNLIREE